jgi:Dolichyl-phosphate-mannose-protein mannosyltransferase
MKLKDERAGSYCARMNRRWVAAIALLIAIALARVASTHRVFSPTADEPVHIASGYDWITRGVYVFDPEHPPLARGLFGLGLRMGGVVSAPAEDWKTLQPTWLAAARGMDLLGSADAMVRNLANARRGNLVFLLIALIAVAAWAWRAFGPVVAVLAVALFGSLPPILAHAGVATTDMAAAATLTLALLALERFLDRPTLPRTLLLGAAIGIGLASKLSFALFFAIGAAIVIVSLWRQRGRGPRIEFALLAIAIAVLVVWSVYHFESGTIADVSPSSETIAKNVPIPAPTFAVGLLWAKAHEARGHAGFLLGEQRTTGWWYYFPVALAVKTPLPFLLLFLFGAIRLRNSELRFALIPIALLLAVMPVKLNIGVRHVLVVYPMMAIVAAFGARELWRGAVGGWRLAVGRRTGRIAAVVVLAWHFIGTTLAHPDYLAWFNEAAGTHPERILVDSNLDWGQDMYRLAHVAREEKIEQLSTLLFGPAGFDRILPPHTPLAPGVPTQGWIAVSETALASANRGDYDWLRAHRPVRRVGQSIRLYFVE